GIPVAVGSAGEFRRIRDERERERADPVVPMALVACHNESRAGAYRAERPDDEAVGILVRQEIARALIERMAVIVAGIVAVATDGDAWIGHLPVERDALERAFEDVFHDCTCMRAAMARHGNRDDWKNIRGACKRRAIAPPGCRLRRLLASTTRKRD